MTQFATASDGVRLAYDIAGKGADTIVLVHGFASSRAQNWRETGWYDTLTKAGLCVVALDCRGHGESDKPHAPEGYRHDEMARDVLAVMDDADVAKAHVMGYSMGGFISMQLAATHPERMTKLVVGGVGETYFGRDIGPDARRAMIADALVAADPKAIANPTGRAFRAFADQPGKDRLALAACMRAPSVNLTREQLAAISLPALVVCGENDDLTGGADGLARAFAHGRVVTVPNRDHMTVVGDKVYKQAALDFLLT